MPTSSKAKLWVLAWGLFPRRVTIYLKEKGIHNHFDIVPLEVTPTGLESCEGKPAGSVPILEIPALSSSHGGSEGEDAENRVFIFQSIAIIEYLEDLYGPEAGYRSMRGQTAAEKARVRDCMNVLSEAVDCFAFYCHQASQLFQLNGEEQSRGAAVAAIARAHAQLDRLEELADSLAKGPWLVNLASASGGPTTVDCVLMALLQFAHGVYGYDLTERHARLRAIWEAFADRESARMEEVPVFVREMAPVLSVR